MARNIDSKNSGAASKAIAEHVSALAHRVLPRDVLETAALHVLDTIGVAIAGSTTPHARDVARGLDELGDRGDCTIFASGTKRSLSDAILLNGTMAHAIDFDDSHKFVHPGCTVVPVALGFAERYGSSALQFLKSVIAGYEVSVRVSLAGGPAHRAAGYHPTGTCNVFGAVAAAAGPAGLDAEAIERALGIASSQASGLTQYRLDGAATKHLHAGLAGRSGALAVVLAKAGFHGTVAGIEGELGFLGVMAPGGGEISRLTDGLGERFAIQATDMKPYPSCRQTHAPVDLAISLMRRGEIGVGEIDRIELRTYAYNDKPWYLSRQPGSSLEAMLSIPFCLAMATARGRLTLADFESSSLSDPIVQALIDRVHVTVDDEITARWPGQRGATLTITGRDGQSITDTVSDPSGGVARPMSSAAVVEKFRALAQSVLGVDRTFELEAAVLGLPDASSIQPLLTGVSPGPHLAPGRLAQASTARIR